jgi:hypothetical protein
MYWNQPTLELRVTEPLKRSVVEGNVIQVVEGLSYDSL